MQWQFRGSQQGSRMARRLQLFFACFGIAFVLGSIGYVGLKLVLPNGRVFGALPRMFLYHEAHPFEYIALVALSYGAVVTICVPRFSHRSGWSRRIANFAIMCASVLLASVAGGFLWKIHDMQAGFFPSGARFWSDLTEGAAAGLQVGWLIALLSFPYKLLGLIAGYLVTAQTFKITARLMAPIPERSYA